MDDASIFVYLKICTLERASPNKVDVPVIASVPVIVSVCFAFSKIYIQST